MYPTAPRKLLACTVPSGRVGVAGTPSGSPVALPGILKAIQCKISSTFFCGAVSGSCMIRAKLTTPDGTLVQSSFGETGFGSDCVYLFGITEPSSKADVVKVSPGRAGALGWAAGCCAEAVPAA